MKSKLFLGLLFLTASFCVNAQVPESNTRAQKISAEKAKTLKDSINRSNQSAKTSNQNGQSYVRPDSKTRFNRYIKSMVGPAALAKSIAGAGYSTWTNSPEEWGNHWEGFGKRVASNMGKSVINNTTRYSLEEAFKLDSHYYRSQNKSVGARLKNALLSPVTARNKNGKRVFGFPRVVGTYTGSIVAAEAWYPERYNYKDGLRSGTISLGMGALYNVFREFVLK